MSIYAAIASVYDELFPLGEACLASLDALAPKAAGGARRRVLDLGCATGSLLLALAERDWEGLGFEPEAAMLAIARAQAERKGLGRVRFLQENLLEAPELAGTVPFDLVLCLGNTLPHLSKEGARRFFSIARQLLAPSGSLVLQLLNYAKPGIGPGLAFPTIELPAWRFERRYEAGPEGKLRFVAGLANKQSKGSRESEVLLEPLMPKWIVEQLGEAGFDRPRLSSGWNGDRFDESLDGLLLVDCRVGPLSRA